MPKQRRIIILAGPNGAARTTFAREYLLKEADCPEIIDETSNQITVAGCKGNAARNCGAPHEMLWNSGSELELRFTPSRTRKSSTSPKIDRPAETTFKALIKVR